MLLVFPFYRFSAKHDCPLTDVGVFSTINLKNNVFTILFTNHIHEEQYLSIDKRCGSNFLVLNVL